MCRSLVRFKDLKTALREAVNRIYTLTYYCDTDRALQQEDVLLRPREVSSESPEANE